MAVCISICIQSQSPMDFFSVLFSILDEFSFQSSTGGSSCLYASMDISIPGTATITVVLHTHFGIIRQ